MSAAKTITQTNATGLPLIFRGKVRDIYQIDEHYLLLVATDRISAFDCVFPNPIPYKGAVLTVLTAFWLEKLKGLIGNHLVTADFDKMPDLVRQNENLRGRAMMVKKTAVFPVECIVRGYLEGSGWKDYQNTGEICGHRLPSNLRQCEQLPQPIFTPATKAASGHDVNVTENEFAQIVGAENALILKSVSLEIYRKASEFALSKGIIIADTKFEFGVAENGEILLIDEVLTPDSSRFWSQEEYAPGKSQSSFDKQFVREYLETLDWNKQPPAPELPEQIIEATSARYLEAYQKLVGEKLSL